MTGPLIPMEMIPEAWNNVIAVLLGMAFGFTLEASGFSSSRKIMGTFFGYDFVVLRVFFTAGITAMSGIIYFDYMGWMDASMLYINPYYVTSAIVGGIVMGGGFALGGFCPGTSFCGVAIGKIDAILFTAGLFIGIFIFSEFYPVLSTMYNSENLGDLKIYEMLGMRKTVFAFLLVLAAVGMFYGAGFIEKKVKKVEY
ncbi:MAG: YeeE/YedE family protein [Lentimicrobiaceae bacterium]|nr:YeeE/YedE family protein [Lentimicrobiaceae bacterium]MCO5266278.1 YeeE/YedE family protein [Lentimicrobium sp.]HPG32989.1 YeeE/YedE thiosulfate transporter family protein [Lentimicrobium sp.]